MKSIFCATVLRQCSRTGEWFLMDKQTTGWASFAYGPYVSLDDVRAAWAVTIGGAGEDAFGSFRRVTPVAIHALAEGHNVAEGA